MSLTRIERSLAPLVLSSFAPLADADGFAIRNGEVDWAGGLEKFVSAASEKARLGIFVTMVVVFFGPLLFLGRLRTLARSAADERALVMERLLAHRVYLVRELGLLLKLVACMAMFRCGSLRARTGFDGPARTASPLRVLAA